MQYVLRRIGFLAICLLFFVTTQLQAATERRVALVIGNSSYSSSPLVNPVNDAADIAATLKRLDFSVTLKKNVTLQDMENSVRNFGDNLKQGGVGLFFYAGHGVQISGKNYLIPIGARIKRSTDLKYQAMDTEMLLDEMGNAGNNLNIVILDACRDNPFPKSYRSSSRGLAIVSNAPTGTFITYSTSPGKVATDGTGRNSSYAAALIQSINEPGLTIEQAFKRVRNILDKETGGQQVPWELSSLTGEFYFNTQNSTSVSGSVRDKTIVTPNNAEQKQLEQERLELERLKMGLERENLEAERKRIEAARKQLEEKKMIGLQKHVLANWTRDDYWYPGTITDIKENLYFIHFDDGDKEWVDASRIRPENIKPGDRVYGNWKNRGKYYPGTVTQRTGLSIHISYDDGDQENTTISFVRVK